MSAGSDVAALDILSEAVAQGFEVDEDVAQHVAVSDESEDAAEQDEPQATTEAPQAEVEDTEDEVAIDFSLFKPVGEEADDEDEDDEIAPAAVVVEDDEDEDESDEWVDPAVQKERARIRQLEKQLEHEKKLRVQTASKGWRKKLESQYPLADFDGISATSRRSYERAAQESHNRHAKVLAPHIAKLEEAKAALAAAGFKEGKTEAQKAWGKPTTGPQVATLEAAAYEAGIAEARKGGLQAVISYMRKNQKK